MRFLLALTLISKITAAFSNTRLQEPAGKQVYPDTTVYMIVQVPAAFPGGNGAMFRFIQSTTKYAVIPTKGSIVQLRLLIEKDGSISEVKTTYTDLDEKFTEEATRIINAMPKWIPGSQDGQVLRSYAVIAIRFANAKK